MRIAFCGGRLDKGGMLRTGRIVSLHVHPVGAGDEMIAAEEFNFEEGKGIREDKRYFGRSNRKGEPSRRQVTLMERDVLREHCGALGVADLEAGQARSNIETEGIDLVALLGRDVKVGEAVLRFVEARTPCHKMDALVKGLRELMEDGRQGVIAIVVRGGRARVGDLITPLPASAGSEV